MIMTTMPFQDGLDILMINPKNKNLISNRSFLFINYMIINLIV